MWREVMYNVSFVSYIITLTPSVNGLLNYYQLHWSVNLVAHFKRVGF